MVDRYSSIGAAKAISVRLWRRIRSRTDFKNHVGCHGFDFATSGRTVLSTAVLMQSLEVFLDGEA
jgi:hypothetical protein